MNTNVLGNISVFLLVLMFSSPCGAAADVAKRPVSVTQDYLDGSSTRFACFEAVCRFSIVKDRREVSYEVPRVLFGYHLVVDAFNFHEETIRDSFHVSLPVMCTDEDLGMLPEPQVNSAECDMQLEPRADVLIAVHIRVSGIVAGRYMSRLRMLRSSPPSPKSN